MSSTSDSLGRRAGRAFTRLVVTLLGAEPRPMRGWEQGAALLDWGFSLPRDASVGRLVDPGETTSAGTPSPAPLTAEPRAVAAHRSARSSPWPIAAAVTVVAVAAAVAVTALVRRRRRRG